MPPLDLLLERRDLTADQAEALVAALARGEVEPALAGAILAALRAKGEAASEVMGFARGLRAAARPAGIPQSTCEVALDIVGTGGDGSHTFNLSTAAALLCAALGVPIIKHGNRAITSRSGSADVLAALGLPMPMDEYTAAACLASTGFTFLFAPHYHPATAAIGPIRRSLKARTIFNMLGPLTNPAQPRFALLGAYSLDAARLMARACAGLGSPQALLVHSDDGTDEPTPASAFQLISATANGSLDERRIEPWTLGVPRCEADSLRGGDAEHNAAALRRVFAGERSAHRDAVVLGAALGLLAAQRVPDLPRGLADADAAIADGRAASFLDRLQQFAQEAARG